MARLAVKNWYPEIAIGEDLDRIPDAIEYYTQVEADGARYLSPRGNLEQLLFAQAGLIYFYEGAYNDALKIFKWLESKISYERAKLYKWFCSEEGKATYGELKSTDIKQFIEADNNIYELMENLGYIDSAKIGLSTLVERLRERGIHLSMIAKLRAAGQFEIMIDASQETPLED